MLLASFGFLSVLTGQTVEDKRFPDTPENHWAYEAVSYLRSEGLLNGYPDGLGRGFQIRNKRRIEFGQIFCASVKRLKNLENQLWTIDRKIAHEPAQTRSSNDDLARRENLMDDVREPVFSRSLDYLEHGGKEFALELRAFGVLDGEIASGVAQARGFFRHFRPSQPGIALQQFPDVPANHWAAKSILDLRSNGLLDGYPDNRFNP